MGPTFCMFRTPIQFDALATQTRQVQQGNQELLQSRQEPRIIVETCSPT